ncbi:DUF3291 domain-containing protein [Amycolatopsis sp., V23-08]|uniref:DUF3291 domain-containing protein n=1 Tax=Amycolatopsis heterodermiae TaxID=3110235 RepID=A0ABU5R821_9PSEU|nr:DUF3291 domain-containing protein [Amycolatopsis sp., V23-08]MEA5362371.1 DUF3291 domain-containing protein [Amycolatopsis sp., V23-08]
MSTIALYTFGLLDPAMEPAALADLAGRGDEIYSAGDHAPGFLGRAEEGYDGDAVHQPGEDFGPWGSYVLPLGLTDLAGHDPHAHIATLSLWRDVGSARLFVYSGLHREALQLRYDWFLKGSWPGHVLWSVEDGSVPRWSDGVANLEALALDGSSARRFTFGSQWGRT